MTHKILPFCEMEYGVTFFSLIPILSINIEL
jgi:hypothetical protein